MALENSSPWADWVSLNLSGLAWFFSTNPTSLLAPTDIGVDVLDSFASNDVRYGTTPKPTIKSGPPQGGETGLCGYFAQIAVPDFIPETQSRRLTSWSGVAGDPYGEPQGVRRALLIENVLVGAANVITEGDPVAEVGTLEFFGVSAKFRGYGAPSSADPDAFQTQDAPVGPLVLTGVVGPFDDMGFPGNFSGGTGTNDPIDFSLGDDGIVARIQNLIEIPDTVAPGDMVELIVALQLPPQLTPGLGVQWYATKYKWISTPFPLDANTGAQLTSEDEEGQPRTDPSSFAP